MPKVSDMLTKKLPGATGCPRCDGLRKYDKKYFCLLHDPEISDEWRRERGIPVQKENDNAETE